MSDIVKCQDKKLKITTETNKTFEFKINEIENCIFEDKKFEYDKPQIEEPPKKDISEQNILPGIETPECDHDCENCTLFEDIPEISEIRNILKASKDEISSLQSLLPKENQKNLELFLNGLKDRGINPFEESLEIFDFAMKAMDDEERMVNFYIDKYCEYRKKKWGH